MKTPNGVELTIGQRWVELDKRYEDRTRFGRVCIVTALDEVRAKVQINSRTWAKLSRFHGKSGGYKPYEEAHIEVHHLPVKAYRDKEGNPCCASNFTNGEVCIFYRTQKLGCHETCAFGNSEDPKLADGLQRRHEGEGTLIPMSNCPVWGGKV